MSDFLKSLFGESYEFDIPTDPGEIMEAMSTALETHNVPIWLERIMRAKPKEDRLEIEVLLLAGLDEGGWPMISKDRPAAQILDTMMLNAVASAAPTVQAWERKAGKIADEVADAIPKKIAAAANWTADSMVQFLLDRDVIDKEYAEQLRGMLQEGMVSPAIGVGLLAVIAMGTMTTVFMEGQLKKMTRMQNEKLTPDIPDFHEFIRTALWDEDTVELVKKLMRQQGIPDTFWPDYERAAKQYLQMPEIGQLLYRGEIDRTGAKEHLAKAGFTGEEANEMMALYEIIPPVQDIISMAVREAFDPEAVSAFGLHEEFPPELLEWGQKQGLSEEWLRAYWAAHWVPLSPQLAYEMLHRDVIGEKELDTILRAADFAPFVRPWLKAISYTPYTRVDVRRMHKVGVLSDEEVFRSYKDLGYDDEKAKKMQEFTIRHNRGEEFKLSKAQVLTGYKKQMISATMALAYLRAMDYSQAEAEFILALEDFNEAERKQTSEISLVEKKYKIGLIDTLGVRQALGEMNLPGTLMNEYIDEWDVEKRAKVQKPSREILSKWLVAGMITTEEFDEEMRGLGWSDKYITLFRQELGKV